MKDQANQVLTAADELRKHVDYAATVTRIRATIPPHTKTIEISVDQLSAEDKQFLLDWLKPLLDEAKARLAQITEEHIIEALSVINYCSDPPKYSIPDPPVEQAKVDALDVLFAATNQEARDAMHRELSDGSTTL